MMIPYEVQQGMLDYFEYIVNDSEYMLDDTEYI